MRLHILDPDLPMPDMEVARNRVIDMAAFIRTAAMQVVDRNIMKGHLLYQTPPSCQ